MACLFGFLALISPRLAFGVIWIFSDRVEMAFDHIWMAVLGLLFLPWTALVYTLAYAPEGGVSSKGWALVFLAFLVDVYSYVRSTTARTYEMA